MEKIKNFFTGMTTQTKWILALGTAAVVTTVVMVSGGGGSSLGGDSPMGATGNAASSDALKVIPKNTIDNLLNNTSSEPVKVPKKRGRKPKNKVDQAGDTINANEKDLSEEGILKRLGLRNKTPPIVSK